VDPFFAWIEHSALSDWIRSSDCVCAFPMIVTLHNIGMAFLAGCGIAIDLRIIGFAPGIPIKPMARLVPLMWLAFAINATTGVLLLIAYPTKALTNPLFYIKLSLVVVALTLVYFVARDVLRGAGPEGKPVPANAKRLAGASLAAWLVLIAAGRYLAYTHKWEMLGVPAVL
jgi:hypothetical protein